MPQLRRTCDNLICAVQNAFHFFTVKAGIISGPDIRNNDNRLSGTDSPRPHTGRDDYFSIVSPREAKRIRRTRYFIDGTLRRKYSSSTAIATSYSADGCYYSPSLAASGPSFHSLPGGLSPLEPYFFPPLPVHRRTTSDSAAAMSIVSSASAPCSLSSGSYSSTSSTYSGYSTVARSEHRRTGSHRSRVDEMGVVRRADGRPVNALDGESFQQRWVAPFTFRRVSSTASQPTTPNKRSFSPSVAHSVDRAMDIAVGSGRARLGGFASEGELARGGQHRFSLGLRELGKKIRRRMVSRRHDAMDPRGSGSNVSLVPGRTLVP